MTFATGAAIEHWSVTPRFYLHLCNGDGFTEDGEGSEHADLNAARKEAVDSLRDIAAGELRDGNLNLSSFIEIEDEAHRLVETVHFAQAIRVQERTGAGKRKGARIS